MIDPMRTGVDAASIKVTGTSRQGMPEHVPVGNDAPLPDDAFKPGEVRQELQTQAPTQTSAKPPSFELPLGVATSQIGGILGAAMRNGTMIILDEFTIDTEAMRASMERLNPVLEEQGVTSLPLEKPEVPAPRVLHEKIPIIDAHVDPQEFRGTFNFSRDYFPENLESQYLVGPTSAGKTSAVQQWALDHGLDVRMINLSAETDLAELIGERPPLMHEKMLVIDGEFERAWADRSREPR